MRGAILFGAMSVLGRMYTTIPGAETYAILLMNLLVPMLNSRRLAYARAH